MQKDIKTVELVDLFYNDGSQFFPSDKEKEVVSRVVDLFRDTQTSRDRNFQHFDGVNLLEYIEDSVLRTNTNIDERDGIEDWQAGIHDPITRNKVLAFHGKVMEALPIAVLYGRGDEDSQRGMLLSDIYEALEDIDDYEELMSVILFETIVKGTGIGFEDVVFQNKKYRDVTGHGDNITVTEHVEKTTKLVGQLVPLEEFYPASVSIRRMEDQPYAFWRKVIPFSRFRATYSDYKKSELVHGKESYAADSPKPYYSDFIDNTIADGSVEVLTMYDKMNDELVIIGNGIWLNPLENEIVSPMPWTHKELPFWDIKFDLFGDFFYGKSLPDRLKSMQDVLNVLTNMLLDQSFLTIFPPLLTNGFDSIEDDYLRPGRRTPVDTQGLPINQAFQVLQSPTPSGWHQFILEYTRNVMEESSLDKVSQGVAGGGDRTTAQEIRVAASGVSSMLQIFARLINRGIKRKAMLKIANFLQYGMNSDAPILRQIAGEGSSETAKKAFTTIRVDNTTLTNGKRGTKLIELYGTKDELPVKGSVKARAEIAKKNTRAEVEIVAITPNYIRNFKYDIKIIPNPKSDSTKDVERALQLEKAQMYVTLFPEFINKAELAAQTAIKFGDDPTKMLNDQAFGIEAPAQPMPGMEGNNASNQVRSASGGEQVQAEMAAMMPQA